MSSKISVGALSALLLVIANNSVQAQAASAPDPAPGSGAIVYVAKGVRPDVRIDGFVSEPMWTVAEKIDRFTQVSPSPRAGQPASEQTDVRILSSNKAVLVSAWLLDMEHEKVATAPGKADAFVIAFDVSHDQRAALVLTVEANGQTHAAIVRDGVKSDLPDLKWEGAARRNAKGWSAEIMLPYSSLAEFAPAAKWGWQARRYIARKDELSVSTSGSSTEIRSFDALQLEAAKSLKQAS